MTSQKAGYPALSTFASSAGCACKIGQFDLSALLKRIPSSADPNLLVGHASSDDAAVYRLSGGQAIVQTIVLPPAATISWRSVSPGCASMVCFIVNW